MQDVPKIVRQQLKVSQSAAEPHPDADLLTAFAEHSLDSRERAFVIEHLARCGDCRDVVALALPATEAVAVSASSGTRIGWLSWPALRWGVVAAGLLTVTSIGVLQYRQRHQEKTVASNFVQTNAAADTVAQSVPVLSQTPVLEHAAPHAGAIFRQLRPMNRAASGGGIGAGQAVSPRHDAALAQASASPAPAQQPTSPPGSTQQVGVASKVVDVQSEVAQATPQATAQNQVQDQLVQKQKELPLNDRNLTGLEVVKAKDPVPEQAAARPASAPPLFPSTPLQTSPALMLRASPHWAISSAGVLQRSFDAGKTWEDVNPKMNLTSLAPPNSSPVFHAVAAAGLEVWAGGSALYHSVDGGNRWTLVLPSAAGIVLTGAITSIQFPDPQHGTVATSNAEVWTTADNGQTWHKQQ